MSVIREEADKRLQELISEHITEKNEFKLSDECLKILFDAQSVPGLKEEILSLGSENTNQLERIEELEADKAALEERLKQAEEDGN